MAWLYLLPVMAMLAAFGFGATFVNTYKENVTKVEQLEHQAELTKQRLASYIRMIERRDAAIDASKCNEQIDKWVKNPDDIPTKFAPFDQLNPPVR